jgi:uncharacterized protein YjbI with pentapeptide repeats
MEQHNNNPNQVPSTPIKSGFSSLAMIYLLLGILIGITVILAYQRYLPQVTRTFYLVTLTIFGLLVLIIVLLYLFKKQITTFFFGSATANAGEVIEDAQRVTDALIDRFTNTLLRDVAPGVLQRVRYVLPRFVNWFIWSRFRNWWWQWVLGIFVSLGGLTGTLLLMNQNELLEAQNIKIDSQTILMQKQTELAQQQISLSEASRRSALVVLMSNIMDKVDREIESQQKGLSFPQKEERKYKLSQSLVGQIAALSHSFKPYRYMDGDTLIARALSPERGQLLITLTLLPLDTFTLNKLYQSATFESADLQRAVLNRADLSRVNLSEANLIGADLSETNLISADLSEANLIAANLSKANLIDVNLSGANLYFANLDGANLNEAYLGEAYLKEAIFVRADLRGADLEGADLRGANLYQANLCGANLSGADFSRVYSEHKTLFRAYLNKAFLNKPCLTSTYLVETNLSGANLSGAKLSINQLSRLYTLYNCENLHDSLRLPLQQSHPQLFQKPKEGKEK